MGRKLSFDIDAALDAAMGVFWEKGYEGSSLDDLTEAMGIGRPSLYHSFGSKEQLFRQVLRRYERQKLGFAWLALRLPTVRQVVGAFIDGFVTLATCPYEPKGCLGTHAVIACSDDAAPVRTLILARRQVYLNALARRFRQAKREGDIARDADPVVIACYVMTVVNGLAIQAKYGLDRATLAKTAEMAIAALDDRDDAHALRRW
jgi:AcrR family transcriptional regulator